MQIYDFFLILRIFARKFNLKTMDVLLKTALAALRNGETLLYPTDTIWGIGCDATNAAAVERIYALKKRDRSKSMLILCADLAMVEAFVGTVSETCAGLLLHSGRPTTVIVPLREHQLADNLAAADGTLGVRIPQMAFCQQLLHAFGKPVVSTSANFSGAPSPIVYADIDDALKARIDCCLPDDEAFRHPATGSSRIVKIETTGEMTIIRP